MKMDPVMELKSDVNGVSGHGPEQDGSRSESSLVLDGRRRETRHPLLQKEAPNAIIPFAPRPNDENISELGAMSNKQGQGSETKLTPPGYWKSKSCCRLEYTLRYLFE